MSKELKETMNYFIESKNKINPHTCSQISISISEKEIRLDSGKGTFIIIPLNKESQKNIEWFFKEQCPQ